MEEKEFVDRIVSFINRWGEVKAKYKNLLEEVGRSTKTILQGQFLAQPNPPDPGTYVLWVPQLGRPAVMRVAVDSKESMEPMYFGPLPAAGIGNRPEFGKVDLESVPQDDWPEAEFLATARLEESADQFLKLVDELREIAIQSGRDDAVEGLPASMVLGDRKDVPPQVLAVVSNRAWKGGLRDPQVVFPMLLHHLRTWELDPDSRRIVRECRECFGYLKRDLSGALNLATVWVDYLKSEKLSTTVADDEAIATWLRREGYQRHAIGVLESLVGSVENYLTDPMAGEFEDGWLDMYLAIQALPRTRKTLALLYLQAQDVKASHYHWHALEREGGATSADKAEYLVQVAEVLANLAKSPNEVALANTTSALATMTKELTSIVARYQSVPARDFLNPAFRDRTTSIEKSLASEWGPLWKKLRTASRSNLVILHSIRESEIEKASPGYTPHLLFKVLEDELHAAIWEPCPVEERKYFQDSKDHPEAAFPPVLRILERAWRDWRDSAPAFMPKRLVILLQRRGQVVLEALRVLRQERNRAIHEADYSDGDAKRIRGKLMDSGLLLEILEALHLE